MRGPERWGWAVLGLTAALFILLRQAGDRSAPPESPPAPAPAQAPPDAPAAPARGAEAFVWPPPPLPPVGELPSPPEPPAPPLAEIAAGAAETEAERRKALEALGKGGRELRRGPVSEDRELDLGDASPRSPGGAVVVFPD